MAATAFDAPETLGFDPARLALACDLLGRWCAEDRLPAAALCVGRKGGVAQPWLFGRQRLAADSPPLCDDALFLVASITKPVTVTAVLMLVERGELTLGDRVARFLPDFADNGKADVQVRHLMTHTSGLPNQLPSNFALRRAHRPLSDFVAETCRQPLLHAPGTRVSYQSMGTAVLAAIVQRITGRTLAQF